LLNLLILKVLLPEMDGMFHVLSNMHINKC
jgi:hypothetical protein